jgi:thiol-disulfide isomerase/thioredoxin
MKLFFTLVLIAIKFACLAQAHSPKPVFVNDSASYKGIIKGYVAKSGSSTGMVYVNNVLKGTQESSLIRIDADGSFSAKFLLQYPQDVFVNFPGAGFKGCTFSVYMEPGKAVFQIFDPVSLNKSSTYPVSTFAGELARINTALMQTRKFYHQLDYSEDEVKNNPLFFEELLVKRLASLARYRDSIGLDEKTFQYLRVNVKLAILVAYASHVTDEQSTVSQNRINALKDLLKSQALHEPINVISANYKYLINKLQYSNILVPALSDNQFLEIMKGMSAEISFTPQEMTELGQMKRKDEYITFFNAHPKYTGEISAYFTEQTALQKITSLQQVLGLPNGLLFDLMRTQIYSQLLEDFFSPFSEKKIAAMRKIIATPFLITALTQHSQAINQKIKANQMMVNAPKMETQQKWEEIMAKFKGKVIYVDFWATWCGPCRTGIEAIATLKAELKDQEIAFVYITNQSSPKEIYENMIPSIDGNHFRLSNDEWNLISSKFKISGIPHEMLIGKDGQMINTHLPPLNNEALREKLLAATRL